MSDLVPLRTLLEQFWETPGIDAPFAGSIGSIRTGFMDLDTLLGGFHRSDLVICAARPSVGKSALLLNFARNAAVGQNARVAIFTHRDVGRAAGAAPAGVGVGHRRVAAAAGTDVGDRRAARDERDGRAFGAGDLHRRLVDRDDRAAADEAAAAEAAARRRRPRADRLPAADAGRRAGAATIACRR